MDPNYLQPPENSFATSNDGNLNGVGISTDRSNRLSWPSVNSHIRNRLSVSSNPGIQPSFISSDGVERASGVSLDDVSSNPLFFNYPDPGTAVEAPLYGTYLSGDLSQLDAPGGGKSSRTGSSYDDSEVLSSDPNILVNASLQRLEELQGPYKMLKVVWRNEFREILAVPDSMPDYILERVGLAHELVITYKERLESVKEVTLEQAFEVGSAKNHLQSTERVLAMYCEINSDTMFSPRYQVDSSLDKWFKGLEEEQKSPAGAAQVQSADNL